MSIKIVLYNKMNRTEKLFSRGRKRIYAPSIEEGLSVYKLSSIVYTHPKDKKTKSAILNLSHCVEQVYLGLNHNKSLQC